MEFLESEADVKAYVLQEGLDQLLEFSNDAFIEAASHKKDLYGSVDASNVTPYPPDWKDLSRLRYLVRQRKVLTVLEFGTGYSTLVMADAMLKNKKEYGDFARENIRREHAFKIFIVEASAEWTEQAADRLPGEFREIVEFHHAPVEMGTFQDRICTYYENLPNVCPDFIYVDGPDQHNIKGAIRGVSTAALDRLPMAADLLPLEYHLLPGTLVLFDGRTSNARFVKDHFQRRWAFHHDLAADISTLELTEPAIGKKNQQQLNWQLGDDWLKKVVSES